MARNDKSVNTKVGTVRKIFWAFSAVFFSCFFFIIFNAMREVQWRAIPTPAPVPVAKAEPKPVVEPEPEPEPVQPEPPVVGRKWYEGGTLHTSTVLEWQDASDQNKVATCADWIVSLWKKKALVPRIQNSISEPNDLKPYALALAIQMQIATKKADNEVENKRLFANQKAHEFAAAAMILMKWIK